MTSAVTYTTFQLVKKFLQMELHTMSYWYPSGNCLQGKMILKVRIFSMQCNLFQTCLFWYQHVPTSEVVVIAPPEYQLWVHPWFIQHKLQLGFWISKLRHSNVRLPAQLVNIKPLSPSTLHFLFKWCGSHPPGHCSNSHLQSTWSPLAFWHHVSVIRNENGS